MGVNESVVLLKPSLNQWASRVIMIKCIALATLLVVCWPLPPEGHADDHPKVVRNFDYRKTVDDIGGDLRRALGAAQRRVIATAPVRFNDEKVPAVWLTEVNEDGGQVGAVVVSAGFIDLCRNVSHAKAIDVVRSGYFDRYIHLLSEESGASGLKPLPDIDDPGYWTPAVMNDQQTNLRQMVGLVVGTKLAHHYLGQYKKYSARILDAQGRRTPINQFLSAGEFEDALLAGTRLALDTGLGLEGCKALYDAIGHMDKRPAWTASFLPESVKVKALKKRMEKVERKFFGGDE